MKAFLQKIAYVVLSVGIVLSPLSCRKKKGCVDPNAVNYCDACNENAGCEYDVTFVFWFDSAFSHTLQLHNIDSVHLYLSDQHNFHSYVGSYSRHHYFEAAPTCTDSGVVKTTLRYAVSALPDACSSGSNWLGGGGSKCWKLNYSANSDLGAVDGGLVFIYPGLHGCLHIKLE